jgi:hypothetical protein
MSMFMNKYLYMLIDMFIDIFVDTWCYTRIVFDLLLLMPFWLVCILHMEHSFLICVVNEFCVSKNHHHHQSS